MNKPLDHKQDKGAVSGPDTALQARFHERVQQIEQANGGCKMSDYSQFMLHRAMFEAMTGSPTITKPHIHG